MQWMHPLLLKLNIKAQQHFFVGNAPESFAPIVSELALKAKVLTHHQAKQHYDCVLLFVYQQVDIAPMVEQILPYLDADALCWFCYPKASSKLYQSDIRRDTSWSALKALGMLSVRMVAIDQDWAALRFRHADFIKVKTRQKSHS